MPQQKISLTKINLLLIIIFIISAVFAFLLVFGKIFKTNVILTNISEEKKVAIMTDKREYQKGEKVNFLLTNKLSYGIFYVIGELNCSTWSYEVYNFSNNNWNKIFTHIPVCVTPENERTLSYDILLSNNYISFNWSQNQWDYGIENYKIQPGRYIISMRYQDRENMKFADYMVFSDEFTIKEDPNN